MKNHILSNASKQPSNETEVRLKHWHNMSNWSFALKKTNVATLKRLAELYDDANIVSKKKKLDYAKLPSNEVVFKHPLKGFFEADYKTAIENANTDKFWGQFVSPNRKNKRRTIDVCTKDSLTDELKAMVNTFNMNEDEYFVIIYEYFKNLYAGNLMVEKDGQRIFAEMVQDTHSGLVQGKRNPDFTVWRNDFDKRFHYSFDDPVLRETVFKMIQCIPHNENHYMPGYYEFVIVDKNGRVAPIFIDYISSELYLFGDK